MLSHAELLELKRWNTPTIYNGWEQITKHDIAADGFNLEEIRDFMPQMGPMVGYAVTSSSSRATRRTSARTRTPGRSIAATWRPSRGRRSSSCRTSTSRAWSAPSGAR